MVKAVIFDVDGTLVDSVELHASAWVDAFAEFGHCVSPEDARRQIGKGGDQLLPVFLSEAEIAATGQDLQARRSAIMAERYLPRITPFPAVRDLLTLLRARGQYVALASSAKAEELQKYKRIAGIEDLVEEETTAEDAERSKPFPDISRRRSTGLAPR